MSSKNDFDDRFLFSVEGLSQPLRVLRFSGDEGLSELFHFELTLGSHDGAIGIDDVVGLPALFTIMDTGGEQRQVHGMVSRFEQGDAGKKITLYHATLVPQVWRLQHRHDIRIFQQESAPDIIVKVLEGAGIAAGSGFRLALQGSYRPREYCVQYRESDWAFVCRLMEEEGILWFFEHHEDKDILVLGDRPAVHAPILGKDSVPFRAETGALVGHEHVSRFLFAGEVRSGKVTLRDWNFQKPTLLLEGDARDKDRADLEVYDYPGVYEAPREGVDLAKIRLEERQALRHTGDGDGGVGRFTPGYTFKLVEHSRESFNRAYVITSVEHEGVEPTMTEGTTSAEHRYQNRFQCIPEGVPFRPPRHTPKPTVKGLQTAIVVGPSGEEIYTDVHGRVKVQFHWDRLGKKDEKSSCWLRVSQVWAGEAWGAMHIPRINQEVLVDFLEGDPDRPIVVGRVYHANNVPPYPLPANKTRSTVKSSSTPGGGGSNELRFEDKKGSEEIYLHAQKDLTILVEHDKDQRVVHDETLEVEHDRSFSIGHDQSEAIGHDRRRSVGNDETASIGNDRRISVGVNHDEEIGSNMTLSIGQNCSIDIGADATESVTGQKALTVSKSYAIDVTSNLTAKVGASSSEQIELDKTIKAGEKVIIECGSAKITVEKSGNITIVGAKITVNASAEMKLSAQKFEVASQSDVKIEASGKVDVKSSGPMSIEASGPLKIKGATVGVN
jgi:type VI secretion system secreted protein VgrG